MNPDLFTEAFLTRLAPLFHEVTLGAIRHFRFEEYPKAALIAAAGALLASALFYFIGIWLRRMPAKVSTLAQQEKIKKLESVARYWLPWLLVLSPTPVGGVLIVAAGFFRLNAALVWAVIFASEAVWRAVPYLR